MAAVLERLCVRRLGRQDYVPSVAAMREFSQRREASTPDELWLLEHPPVYTLGLAADPAHGPRAQNGIPVVRAERGGEITYHGPGQVVLYALVDLARRALSVRGFVRLLEQGVIDTLARYDVRGERRSGAPGVYVGGAKIAALGLRVARGRTTHGVALNVDMDLTPFAVIDPCGYRGLAVTQARDVGIADPSDVVGDRLAAAVASALADA